VGKTWVLILMVKLKWGKRGNYGGILTFAPLILQAKQTLE
jgi:hypothetical protein